MLACGHQCDTPRSSSVWTNLWRWIVPLSVALGERSPARYKPCVAANSPQVNRRQHRTHCPQAHSTAGLQYNTSGRSKTRRCHSTSSRHHTRSGRGRNRSGQCRPCRHRNRFRRSRRGRRRNNARRSMTPPRCSILRNRLNGHRRSRDDHRWGSRCMLCQTDSTPHCNRSCQGGNRCLSQYSNTRQQDSERRCHR